MARIEFPIGGIEPVARGGCRGASDMFNGWSGDVKRNGRASAGGAPADLGVRS
jgi:hypothetical protein